MLNRATDEPADIMTTPDDNWDDLASWWIGEAAADPTYRHDVHPILAELLPSPPGLTADLGCGEGQGMSIVGGTVIGVDLSLALARSAVSHGPCVVARLPDLSMFRAATFDAAYSVYLVDLIEDHEGFFASCSRIVRRGGALVVIMNHPVYTAVGSAPLMDEDGEILWRWGSYFREGSALEPAGHREIRYFHRPLGMLLTAAARHGWRLELMVERGLSAASTTALGVYDGQEAIPRLLGVRWALDGPVGGRR